MGLPHGQSIKAGIFVRKHSMFLERLGGGRIGWIEVICGSMFSGKTEELIRRLRRAQFAGQRVEIFKSETDVRYHAEAVVSHDARVLSSTAVSSSSSLILLASEAEVVGIDEAQFFDPELPAACATLANQGKRVVVAGLDMDFRGKPFGPMPALMAMAEYVTKVHAICVRCGSLATFSHRRSQNKALIELGEKEHYEPLCRSCFIGAAPPSPPPPKNL